MTSKEARVQAHEAVRAAIAALETAKAEAIAARDKTLREAIEQFSAATTGGDMEQVFNTMHAGHMLIHQSSEAAMDAMAAEEALKALATAEETVRPPKPRVAPPLS